MRVVLLKNASLDPCSSESTASSSQSAASDGSTLSDSTSSSASSKSSFNILDSIKRSSLRINSEMKKRINFDLSKGKDGGLGLAMASITESMSMSSDEMAEAVTKTFSIFKGISEESRQEDDLDDDDDDGTIETFEVALSERSSLLSPSERAERLLERLMTSIQSKSPQEESDVESPLHSLASDCDDSSDDEGQGSRVMSLLDRKDSGDHAQFELDRDGSGSDSDGGSPSSTETNFNEFPDELEDALAAIGGAVYRLGSCNFQNLNSGFEDDFSIAAFPANLAQKARNALSRREVEIVPVDTPPKNKDFFEELFGCGG
jgi:hypothetical protein